MSGRPCGEGQTACDNFRTKKQATRAFGRNSGGVIDTDTPELGGFKSKMRIPRGALKGDKYIGMGRGRLLMHVVAPLEA